MDRVGKRSKSFAEDVQETSGLYHEAVKFREKRAVRVRLKVDSIAVAFSAKNPSSDQGSEFSLQTRRRDAQVVRKVTQVPPPLRMHQRGSQNGLPGPGEQGIDRGLLTHIA